MSMFYGGQLQAMLPKLHSKNFEGMELIRPMYCIHEDAILDWKRYNNLQFYPVCVPVYGKLRDLR